MNEAIQTLLVGAGATGFMDAWGLARRPLLGAPRPDYAMLGRWVGHMARGKVRHATIGRASPITHERALGWFTHYATGVAFAAAPVVVTHGGWLQQPTMTIALLTGIGTLAAPFLLMQPAMGAGIAARRSPHPWRSRLQSLITHSAFGFGLFLSASLLNEMR